MTIPVECPHCASVYQLSPDLIGKSMRCPNTDCREVFPVRAAGTTDSNESPSGIGKTVEMPKPKPVQSGGVADFVPILKVETPDAPAIPSGVQHTQIELPYERIETDFLDSSELKPEPAPSAGDELPMADAISLSAIPAVNATPRPGIAAQFAAYAPKEPTAPRIPDEPKQVAWAGEPSPELPMAEAIPEGNPEDDGVFIRTPKKSRLPQYVLAALSVAVTSVLAFIGYGYLTVEKKNEQQLAASAEEAYQGGKFPAAAEAYQELLKRFPDSSRKAEYQFLAALSDARAVADSVSAKEDPSGGQAKLTGFLAEHGNSPYAQPDVTFGADVANLGRRVADNIAAHGEDRLAKFRANRSQLEFLEIAERTTTDGPQVLASVEKFRGKETPGFDDERKKFVGIAEGARKERDRLAVLAPFRDLADDPTDESIELCEVTLRRNGLADDAEAKEIVARAKERLWQLIGSVPDERRAARVPTDPNPPVLFTAAPLGTPEPRPTPDAEPDVAFAVARGVLYAFDAETGKPLWGTRVSAMTGEPRLSDAPVRVTISEGGPEWVLVPSEVSGRRGLTARVARTGEPVWYQPLEFPLAGRLAVVGRRAYVPLADSFGTVLELLLSNGSVLSRSTIRQPVGGGLTGMPGTQSGSGFLFVPADARRVFVFEVGKETADGSRQPPRMVRVVATDHPRDSLRGEPILVNPPTPEGPRYLILPQADGPTEMKLRSFPIPPPSDLAAGDGPVTNGVGPATPAAEVQVPGWAWFPPVADGERIVASTDAGTVAAFGINQAGNADRALYALPTPANPAPEQEAVNRSLVVTVDEDSAWVVVGGKLTRLRTAVDATGGLRILSDSRPEPIGEPIHRAQVRPAANSAVVVTAAGSASARVTAFDLQTGRVRWQRFIGVIPATPPMCDSADRPALVVDESGGVYTFDVARPESPVFAESLAPPAKDPLAPAQVARSEDGSSVWVLIPEMSDGAKRLRVRQIANGVAKPDVTRTLPDLPGGRPIALSGSVIIPLRDGSVYRLTAGGLMKGPIWRSGADPDAVCYLAAAGPDEFLATDGASSETGVTAWRWPADGPPQKRGGPWQARGAITAPPAVLTPGAALRFAVADSTGTVRLFEPSKQDEPTRQWRGMEGGEIPPGPAGGRIDVVNFAGVPRLLYAANRRHVVCLNPEEADPLWVARVIVVDDGPEVVGWAVDKDRLLITDQSARVAAVEFGTGKQLPDVPTGVAGLAAGELTPTANAFGLLPLADGTITAVALPAAAVKPE